MITGKLRLVNRLRWCCLWILLLPLPVEAYESSFELEVNLALREIGHRLLQEQGDSTSAIPPVVFRKDRGFYLKYGNALNYARLQGVMEETFEKRGLPLNYNLALFDCDSEMLVLGYSTIGKSRVGTSAPSADPTGTFDAEADDASCLGREELFDCYHIAVSFPSDVEKTDTFLLMAAIIPILILLMGGAWWWKHTQPTRPIPSQSPMLTKEEPSIYQLGPLRFEPDNQTLLGEGEPQRLTFRESKLLNLFCQHKNQLLARETILEFVWGDEGVMVGRSIDVFVSRLRKKLKPAANIKIASVHGVGYRLEVEEVSTPKTANSQDLTYNITDN